MQDTTNLTKLKTFQSLYQDNQYLKAQEFLKSIRLDIGEWNYHYNMGVLKNHQGELALARYHYLLAQQNDDTSKELRTNLTQIEKKLNVAVHEKPQGLSDNIYHTILGVPDILWSTLSLIIICVGLFLVRKTFKKMHVFLIVILASLPLTLYFWFSDQGEFITIKETIIHDGPSDIFQSQHVLPEGVRLLGNLKGEWIEIYYPSKFNGWIKKDIVMNLRSE